MQFTQEDIDAAVAAVLKDLMLRASVQKGQVEGTQVLSVRHSSRTSFKDSLCEPGRIQAPSRCDRYRRRMSGRREVAGHGGEPERCVSCGAGIKELDPLRDLDPDHGRRKQGACGGGPLRKLEIHEVGVYTHDLIISSSLSFIQ